MHDIIYHEKVQFSLNYINSQSTKECNTLIHFHSVCFAIKSLTENIFNLQCLVANMKMGNIFKCLFHGKIIFKKSFLISQPGTIPISHHLSSPTSLLPFPFLFPFSTLDDQPSPNHIKNEIKPKECFVLDQLSDLLPIPCSYSAQNLFRVRLD